MKWRELVVVRCPQVWWQKNRYDVFMRMARVCQADVGAIAALGILGEKNTK